ncbi:MAG: S8 family serine peptidase, partial [Coriobacteriales bacterium]|nr:S8 family serine peptidase [Coriobacteriales bacterium]
MNAARRLRLVTLTLLLSLFASLVPRAAHVALAEEADSHIEGQAIVGILGDVEPLLSAQSEAGYSFEELMEVSGSAAGISDNSSGGLSAQGDTRVHLQLVTSSTLSTDELITQLQSDPSVVFAEPNQIITFPDTPSLQADLAAQSEPDETPAPVSDLTGLQWGMWEEASYSVIDSAPNPSVNSPAFGPDGRLGDNMANEVIVAVLDMGIDHQNPDLADVMYRFSESEQRLLGCGEWGYNSMGDSTDGVPTPLVKGADHGTHIAGIIGAAWDGHGISGVASNVKIMNIQIIKAGRASSLADSVRAFEFIKRAYNAGIDIRITSNSWGQRHSSLAVDAAVRELGETCGILTFFAAGNDNVDDSLSEINVSQLADNPYAIVVAATYPNDELADFSSHSDTTVDIAAPGSLVLSTVAAESATFLPDAVRDDCFFFEGFEGSESNLSATLTYYLTPEPEHGSDEDEDVEELEGQAEAVEGEDTREGAEDLEGQEEANAQEDVENLKAQEEGNAQEGITVAGEITHDYSFNGDSSLRFPIENINTNGMFPIHIDVNLGSDRMQQLAGQSTVYLGFSLMMDDYPTVTYPQITTNVTGDAKIAHMDGDSAYVGSGWANMVYNLTEKGPITPSEDGHLIVDVNLSATANPTSVNLDSFGIGNRKVAYGFMDGTSMATPLVAGGAAVISSQTDARGAELAAQVRAHARIPDDGPLDVRTGGIFDLSASTPDITGLKILSATAEGSSLTIQGLGFGDEPGGIVLSKHVVAKQEAGRKSEPIGATISSWDDGSIVCTLDEPYSGILRVEAKNKWGLADAALVFVGKSENVYEHDLPFDASTGDPFVSETGGDYETKGPLVGLGCKLYYLPCHQFLEGIQAYKRMMVFDLKKNAWDVTQELPELPEWLSSVSACIYEGKLVVEGSKMYLTDYGVWTDTNPETDETEERVYVFDPATQSWSRASNEGMKPGQTLFNDQGNLKLIGGWSREFDEEKGDIEIIEPLMSYDLNRGVTGTLIDKIPLASNDPSVAARGGTIVVYDLMTMSTMRIRNGVAENLERNHPAFLMGSPDEMEGQASMYTGDPYVGRGSVSPVEGGFILMGPPAEDGSSDTYFMADDSDEFVSYGLRASDARVFSPTSTAYRGRLFVIGSSYVEPSKRFFRATEIETCEYPGDIPCDPEPEPTPELEPAPQPQPQTDSVDPTQPVTPGTDSHTEKSTTKSTAALPDTSD